MQLAVRYLLVRAIQHLPPVSEDSFGSPCAICNNLLMWKRFLNSPVHQN